MSTPTSRSIIFTRTGTTSTTSIRTTFPGTAENPTGIGTITKRLCTNTRTIQTSTIAIRIRKPHNSVGDSYRAKTGSRATKLHLLDELVDVVTLGCQARRERGPLNFMPRG